MDRGMKLLNKCITIFDHTLDFFAILAAAFLIYIALGVTTEVVLRKVLGRPIIWMAETAEYSLLWVTFLVAAWVLRSDGHVKMDLLLHNLNPKTQALINTVTSVVSIIICLALTWFSAQVTWGYFQTDYRINTFVRPPKFLIMLVIPVGSFLLSVQFLRRSYGYFRNWRTSADKK